MHAKKAGSTSSTIRPRPHTFVWVGAVMLPWVLAVPASAVQLDTGNSEIQLRWDNTFKYTNSYRLADPQTELRNINTDDADHNFTRGLISNRLDLLSELDLAYHDVGARVSGAAWYDTVYNRSHDNASASTFNPISTDNKQFPRATRNLVGHKLDLLDAFVYANGSIGAARGNVRLGRHTLLWGESLLIPNNGIASAQAPLDIIKLLSVPNTLAKELFLPVSQLSGSLQITKALSIEAYAQAEWRSDRLAPVESYFSINDLLDVGGERLFAGSPNVFFVRSGDVQPHKFGLGQGGIAAKYRLERADTDLGFYLLNYDDKVPQVVLRPGGGTLPGQIGQYFLIFPRNAHLAGASFSTTIGSANVAGEISGRWHEPLVSTAQAIQPGTSIDADHTPGAVGSSVHAQISTLYLLPPTFLWQGASFSGELAWAHLLSVRSNQKALDTTTNRNALGFRGILTASYYQVVPGLDLAVPIGLGYNARGRSAVVQSFNGDGGADNGGDMSIGLQATYLSTWLGSLSYTRYFEFGSAVKNPVLDRDFVALSLRRAF